MNKIIINTKAQLDELYRDSALTFEGLHTGDDTLGEMLSWVRQYTAIKREDIHIVSGHLMNATYGLTGDNAYADDLNIVCLKLSDMEQPMRLAIPRFEVGGCWFDDVVDNNAMHEEEQAKRAARVAGFR